MAVKSSFRNMTLCLLAICLVCSALLAVVFAVTESPIAAAQQKKTNDAIARVVPAFDGDPVLATIDVDGADCEYYIVSKDTAVVAYAINASSVGFGGPLDLMVGITAEGVIWNTAVLSHSETPGLGAKCTDEAFASQFRQFNPAQKSLVVRKDGGDVDAITASTITSRAYTKAVANAVEIFKHIVNDGGQENE